MSAQYDHSKSLLDNVIATIGDRRLEYLRKVAAHYKDSPVLYRVKDEDRAIAHEAGKIEFMGGIVVRFLMSSGRNHWVVTMTGMAHTILEHFNG